MPDQKPLADVSAMARLSKTLVHAPDPRQKRELIADFFRTLGTRIGKPPSGPADDADLAPRLRQTLKHLLDGDSEKQVAAKLGLSPHTVHIYVKSLYKHFDVSSRGELLAKCLR